MGAESTRLVEWVEWAAEWDDDVADPNSPPALSPPPLVASAEEETAGGCCCCCCGWGKRPGRNVPTSPLVPTPRNRCCCCCCCWPGCPPLCTGSPTEDEASASSGNKSRHYYNYNQKPSPPKNTKKMDFSTCNTSLSSFTLGRSLKSQLETTRLEKKKKIKETRLL